MSVKMSGSKYAAMFGPTTGDKVRLADTSLIIEVEKDYTYYGDEAKFGGGKTLRDGMGQSVKTCSSDGDLDLVITNALIVDYTGIVKADIGVKNGKIVIGPAGENLVRYASIVSNERLAGRGGTGAVMGWKNLKAVTASGNKTVEVHDREKLDKLNKSWFKYLKSHPLTGDQLPRLGTAGLVSTMQMRGQLSTRNYKYGTYDDYEKVSGEHLAEEYNIVNKGCLSCPIKCARTVEVNGKPVKGPELETLGLLGGGILNSDLEAILKWNYELDELGMDTISCASFTESSKFFIKAPLPVLTSRIIASLPAAKEMAALHLPAQPVYLRGIHRLFDDLYLRKL